MSEKNILENLIGIELGKMTLDNSESSTVLTFRTKRNNYLFRLSETFPIEKQADIFRAMVSDLQTEDVPEQVPVEQPVQEKHDGAPLFDETIPAPTNVEIATQD